MSPDASLIAAMLPGVALAAHLAKHRFDLLLFWSLDRLTREGTYKTLSYLRRLSDA